MEIAIGSDKSGFNLKESIKAYLTEAGIEFDDIGTQSIDKVMPYFEVASKAGPLIQNGTYEKAILICGTGAGMNIVANKYKGVYSVSCESLYAAKMCRAINNANVMCMGGWIVAPEMGVEMTKLFLGTDFLEDLEPWRQEFLTNALSKVKGIEDDIYD